MMQSDQREALLKKLAQHVSSSLVDAARRLSTDTQIQNLIANIEAQIAYYKAAGFEDASDTAEADGNAGAALTGMSWFRALLS